MGISRSFLDISKTRNAIIVKYYSFQRHNSLTFFLEFFDQVFGNFSVSNGFPSHYENSMKVRITQLS